MPVINIDMFPGRTNDQKRAIAKEVTEAFVRTAGAKPESVHIIFREVQKEDWAVAGTLVSDR